MFAYIATRHNSTGFSPYYLLFGREPVFPLDLILGLDSQAQVTHSKYVKDWKFKMEEAHIIAKEKSVTRKNQDRKRHDHKHPMLSELLPGDTVLVRNTVDRGGPGKIRSFWEQALYRVSEVKGPGNVICTVVRDNDPKVKRVLHRNIIMPVDPVVFTDANVENKEATPKQLLELKIQN